MIGEYQKDGEVNEDRTLSHSLQMEDMAKCYDK